jgi:hypothetical protein
MPARHLALRDHDHMMRDDGRQSADAAETSSWRRSIT